jgi:hypothetical protein
MVDTMEEEVAVEISFRCGGGDVAVVDGEAELVVAAGINGLVVVGKGREEHGEA